MNQVCAHCGEVYEEKGALVCPHCGADTDLTFSDTPEEYAFDTPEMDAEDYARFLESEGLKPSSKAGRKGCVVLAALLGAGAFWLLWA